MYSSRAHFSFQRPCKPTHRPTSDDADLVAALIGGQADADAAAVGQLARILAGAHAAVQPPLEGIAAAVEKHGGRMVALAIGASYFSTGRAPGDVMEAAALIAEEAAVEGTGRLGTVLEMDGWVVRRLRRQTPPGPPWCRTSLASSRPSRSRSAPGCLNSPMTSKGTSPGGRSAPPRKPGALSCTPRPASTARRDTRSSRCTTWRPTATAPAARAPAARPRASTRRRRAGRSPPPPTRSGGARWRRRDQPGRLVPEGQHRHRPGGHLRPGRGPGQRRRRHPAADGERLGGDWDIPETTIVRTGSGGRHFYFLQPEGYQVGNMKLGQGLDIKGAGGLVVAPPSRTTRGRTATP